jgi:4'-phosphopantetheinyl transferase
MFPILFSRNVTKYFGGKGLMQERIGTNPDAAGTISIYWGGASLVNRYNPALLRPADLARQMHARAPRAEMEWRASRVLLQAIPVDRIVTITHKDGYAAVATAPPGWQVGVDLEMVRTRDIARLAPWMAADHESEALRALAPEAALQHFYRLWTFKEAMIKARSQQFPVDMTCNALSFDQIAGKWSICTPGQTGWSARVFEALPHWVLSVVWRPPARQRADVAWHIESDAPEGDFRLCASCDGGVQT